MNKTLEGIRVLDLTHMLSGPFAAMMLADLGAETIKVEPLQGEGTRRWCEHDPELSIEGMGVYFLTLNRNKQSVALDLKSGPGLEVFHDLVRVSDVVISNFGPGVAERLKIDYPALSVINPRAVTCCITGYGADGPDFQRASFDLVAQATGGMMSVTGLGPEHPQPMGNAHSVHVPYNSYRTVDGFIVIAVLTDRFWQNLKRALECPELERPEFDTQPGRAAARDFIDTTLNAVLAGNTRAHWLERLARYRVPAGPVNSISQAMADPQVLHRNMVVDLQHPNGESRKGPGNPIKLSRSGQELFAPAPSLGQHTDETLATLLGYDARRIGGLRDIGAIG